MAWIYLAIAGLFEIAWAVGMKYTDGFSKPLPTILVVLAMIGSVWPLALATRELPIGTAYAVWVGIGAVGTAIMGMILFNEPRDWLRLCCLGLIVLGVVGLKLAADRAAA